MGGTIDWAALPILAAMYGVDDPETFIRQLDAIRAHSMRQAKAG